MCHVRPSYPGPAPRLKPAPARQDQPLCQQAEPHGGPVAQPGIGVMPVMGCTPPVTTTSSKARERASNSPRGPIRAEMPVLVARSRPPRLGRAGGRSGDADGGEGIPEPGVVAQVHEHVRFRQGLPHLLPEASS